MKFSDASIYTMPLITPRVYQLPVWKAYNSGVRTLVISMPRRAGKDITSLSIIVNHCLRYPNTTAILLAPSRVWAEKIYWRKSQDLIVIDQKTGFERHLTGSLLDVTCPEIFRKNTNQADLRIELHNGSTISLENSDKASFVGMKVDAMLCSELASHKPETFPLLAPILAESSKPLAIYNGTVQSKTNHFFKLIQNAQKLKNYHVTFLDGAETKQMYWISHPDVNGIREFNINAELEGKINPDNNQPYQNVQELIDAGQSQTYLYREFLNRPTFVEEGSYYTEQLAHARAEDRISDNIVWDELKPVFTSWDLGISDKTAVVFYQYYEETHEIKIIDYYENSRKSIEHYINIVRSKPYTYNAHYAPHDIKHASLATGVNLLDHCRVEFQFTFSVIPRTKSVISDILVVRKYIGDISINTKTCGDLITALEAYRENPVTGKPIHDESSHGSDAMRYCVMTVHNSLLVQHDMYGNNLPNKKLQQAVTNVCQNDNLHLGDDDGTMFCTNVDDDWFE